ncbi:MAG: ArsA-related P-loop ATPase [Dermatophilaceae bacterium]
MPSRPRLRASGWPGVRLHIVTGKGGTGKTTVAAALAMALAATGRRVLLAEVEDRQGISQVFDVPPLPSVETPIAGAARGGEIVGLAVDAKAALMEYLQLFYKLGRAGGVLERFGAIDFATTIAPGVRDVLLIGRIYEASRRRQDAKHHRTSDAPLVYDAIVLDAPPTGRIGRFLSVGSEVAGLARMGPIRGQADSLTEVLRSAATRVHVVTLLEDMPVQETIDAVAELRALKLPVGAIVVNQVRGDLLEDSELAATVDPAQLVSDCAAAGLDISPAIADGLVAQVMAHTERLAMEADHLATLTSAGLPVVTVPALLDGIDPDALRQIADVLTEHGMVP